MLHHPDQSSLLLPDVFQLLLKIQNRSSAKAISEIEPRHREDCPIAVGSNRSFLPENKESRRKLSTLPTRSPNTFFVVPDTVESANDSTIMASNGHSGDNESNMPAIRKKERDYEGMLELKTEDINDIIRHVIVSKIYRHYTIE